MKVRFLRKKKGGKGAECPIYVALYHGDNTELIYTGERIALKDWSVKDCAPNKHDSDIYKRIEKIKADVLKVMRLMEAQDKDVTPYSLKQEYISSKRAKGHEQQEKDKKSKTNAVTVSALIDTWI